MSRDELQDLNSVLDSCLELTLKQGVGMKECLERFPQHREELQRLLPLALRLSHSRSLVASDELRAGLVARLAGLQEVGNQKSRGFLVTNLAALRSIFRNWNPIPQRRARMIPALVTFLVVAILSLGGLVAGADAAGPGDLLFGLDTTIENVRLSLTNDEEKEAELHVEFATERLEELKIEIEAEGNGHHIDEALLEFEEALAAIEALLGELTPEQRAELDAAIALLRASSQELTEFEFEFELENGVGQVELELESDHEDLADGDQDDDDLDDDELDDDDLDDNDLDEDDECDLEGSSDSSSDADDDDDDDDDDHDHVDDECKDDDDPDDEDEEDDEEEDDD